MPNLFDTTNAPTTEPTEIVAGNFARWRRTDLSADYPPTTYQLSYECRAEGAQAGRQIALVAAEDGGDYLIQIASATSVDYIVGTYHWFAYITRLSDSERVQVDCGTFKVTPNREDDASDPASFARRMVNQIEDAIEKRADNFQLDTLAYSLGTETSATRDPAQLLIWRTKFRGEIRRINQRNNAKKGRRPSNYVQVSFK